jgi:molecular chaperone Hsp33
MIELSSLGRVVLRRHLVPQLHVIVSTGSFDEFFRAWEAHARVWSHEIDGLSDVLMRQSLAAGVLHLSNRPRDESFGLTIHVPAPPTNVFITGSGRESTVTGRTWTDGVKAHPSPRLYMQSHRPNHEPTLSVLEVHGLDVLLYLEDYYRESEQRPARFFELEGSSFLQVLALPSAEDDLFRRLDRGGAAALVEGPHEVLEERTFFFQCGCNPQRMLRALHDIYDRDPEDLFQGEERVETQCPRCGRRWWMTREEFGVDDTRSS